MTKKEFEEKFNAKYKECLLATADRDKLKAHLQKRVGNNNTISTSELVVETFMLSTEFSKNLLFSVLEDILEFSD